MPEIIKEFRAFVLRGNVVDLAVAVVIGAAFTGWSMRSCATSSRR
jgi:large conductance mechanosensitive channel